MKKIIAILVVTLLPSAAFAANVGECGWGSKLMHGQRGIAPQVLAVTTNGTSGNQTFAITSGTSGCTQDGVIKSSWKTAAYVDANMNKFARDVSRGHGEAIDSFASLAGIEGQDKVTLAKVLQDNFTVIFSSENVTSGEVVLSVRDVLAADKTLSRYATSI